MACSFLTCSLAPGKLQAYFRNSTRHNVLHRCRSAGLGTPGSVLHADVYPYERACCRVDSGRRDGGAVLGHIHGEDLAQQL